MPDLFDPPGRRGAPARIPRRRMVNALLYQARTGCQWGHHKVTVTMHVACVGYLLTKL